VVYPNPPDTNWDKFRPENNVTLGPERRTEYAANGSCGYDLNQDAWWTWGKPSREAITQMPGSAAVTAQYAALATRANTNRTLQEGTAKLIADIHRGIDTLNGLVIDRPAAVKRQRTEAYAK
jgi:hypothetical protein